MARDWKALGRRIRRERIAAGYSSAQALANDVGVTEKTIGTLERGGGAGVNTLIRVELILGLPEGTCDAILDGRPLPTPDDDEPDDPADATERAIWELPASPDHERHFLVAMLRAYRNAPRGEENGQTRRAG